MYKLNSCRYLTAGNPGLDDGGMLFCQNELKPGDDGRGHRNMEFIKGKPFLKDWRLSIQQPSPNYKHPASGARLSMLSFGQNPGPDVLKFDMPNLVAAKSVQHSCTVAYSNFLLFGLFL